MNLTAANNVIHYDLWWNPAVEAQATDRAYRIGQKNNVMVYRMITQGTFEEKIDDMLKMKKHLADMTVSVGENWIGNMSNSDLKAIVSQFTKVKPTVSTLPSKEIVPEGVEVVIILGNDFSQNY